MTLSQRQREFARLFGEFLVWIYTNEEYAVTLGDAFRDPRLHGEFGIKQSYGAANSYHKRRLAVDLNLFINGVFQKTTKAHEKLGAKWLSMRKRNVWGGNFKKPDGCHYSYGERGR